MEQLFLTVLNMSITASYVILFVIIARVFLKKAPKIFSYSLWSVVLFRLICPVSFSSALSFFGFFKAHTMEHIPADIGYMIKPQVNVGIEAVDNLVNSSLPAATPASSVNPMQVIMAILSLLWIIGVIGLLIYSVVSYINLQIKVSTAMLISDNIFECEKIKSPFVLGIITPKIYLPVNLTENERGYILMHEQTHIKRFDYLIKPFAFLVLCFYWFNPLVWISFVLMSRDMEMSCDERVLKEMGGSIKKDYSSSLLALAAHGKMINGSPLAFGESNVKSRIKNVLNYKRPAFLIVVITGVLVTAISVILLANPQKIDVIRDFEPHSIEIDINQQMELINFKENDRENIKNLLQGEKWQKSSMKYKLATMTYMFNKDNSKVIGLYKDVDGYTYIELFKGFGIREGNFYKAPMEVYSSIENYLKDNYGKNGASEISSYNQLIPDLCARYGYDRGVILQSNTKGTEVLLYNSMIKIEEDLLAKKITLNTENDIVNEDDVYLSSDLKGYSFYFMNGDYSRKNCLLAVRSNTDNSQHKIYSDLMMITKEQLGNVSILQSYVQDEMAQGTIPTIIEFSVELIGDYIIYEDTDLYWKVQNVRTKEVYNSPDNNDSFNVIEPYYMASGEYIYILKYVKNNSVLAFDTNSKEFIVLDNMNSKAP